MDKKQKVIMVGIMMLIMLTSVIATPQSDSKPVKDTIVISVDTSNPDCEKLILLVAPGSKPVKLCR